MKKRLLITSIVMMLVVAVALSTATYAWFTSNANVTASTVNITAATNEADALGIGWTGGSASTFIIANDAEGTFKPMAPAFLLNSTTTDSVTFYTATIKSEAGTEVFNDDVKSSVDAQNPIAPYTFTNGSATSFYIKNLSTANSVDNVRVTATFGTGYEETEDTTFATAKTYYKKDDKGFFVALVAGTDYTADETTIASKDFTVYEATAKADGSGLIRVAIFTKESGDASYTLKGVLSKTPAANDTTIANATNTAAADMKVVANGATSACGKITSVGYVDLTTSGLASNPNGNTAAAQVDIIVKVWYDGVVLNDDTAGSMANVSLNFAAVKNS